jgi:hypothetical protein
VGSAIMLLDDRQFSRAEALWTKLRPLPATAIATFILLAVGNVVSTVLICGAAFCPENPGGYLIFNENLQLTLFAGAL